MANAGISGKWLLCVNQGEGSAGIWYIDQVEAGGGSPVVNGKCHWGGIRHKNRTSAKKQGSNMCQNKGEGATATVPVWMQEHRIALTRDRERLEQLRHERFGNAGRPGRLESICKDLDMLRSTLWCPANRLEQWPRIPQSNSEMGWGIWKERLKALSFSTVENELKSSSKEVRKVNPCNHNCWNARQRRRTAGSSNKQSLPY